MVHCTPACQCRIVHDTCITGDLHTRYWLIFQVDVDSIGTDLYRFDLSAVNHVNKLIISDLTLGCIFYHAGNDIRGKHHNQSNHQKNQNAFAAALLFPIVLIATIVRLFLSTRSLWSARTAALHLIVVHFCPPHMQTPTYPIISTVSEEINI